MLLTKNGCEIDGTVRGKENQRLKSGKKKFANIKNKMPAANVPVTRSGTGSKNEGVEEVHVRGM